MLRLKTNSELKNHHIVQQKETLYSISKKYGLTVDALKKMNDLRSNDISIGQELRIK
ncbi:LysM domain-containing protein [Wenyingzhuangia sp. 2_MG-2023]|nr:LysM domain-containing protein [Wenyingzhuangia sp. 2_MG-2023]MDO6737678.1 LysM domain-containing protein [Wenyingzhuangia sp. 2_MG-2023]MDO6802517.1 LysM domain-containing protein [Wenyingzhuangia sp. 1_MG-2023]